MDKHKLIVYQKNHIEDQIPASGCDIVLFRLLLKRFDALLQSPSGKSLA
jgi:hypothetical protein